MYQAKEAEEQKHLEEEQKLNRSAAEQAITEYDRYLAGENKKGGIMQLSEKEQMEKRVSSFAANINGQQQAYNNRKQEEVCRSVLSTKKAITRDAEKSGSMTFRICSRN